MRFVLLVLKIQSLLLFTYLLCFLHRCDYLHQKFITIETEEYSGPAQAPDMQRFAEIVNDLFKPGNSSTESSISDV